MHVWLLKIRETSDYNFIDTELTQNSIDTDNKTLTILYL